MTLTTDIRINHPVPAIDLLNHVSRRQARNHDDLVTPSVADYELANPDEIHRTVVAPGDRLYPHMPWDDVAARHVARNHAGQGLWTLANVTWGESPDVGTDFDTGEPDNSAPPAPPALVVLSIDNPYGMLPYSGRWHQANLVLPTIVKFLDAHGVPRTSWWWEDESWGLWYPGTVDVAELNRLCDRRREDPEGQAFRDEFSWKAPVTTP